MAMYNVSLMDSGHLPKFRRINHRALFAFCRRPVVLCPDMSDVMSLRFLRLLTCTCLVWGHVRLLCILKR